MLYIVTKCGSVVKVPEHFSTSTFITKLMNVNMVRSLVVTHVNPFFVWEQRTLHKCEGARIQASDFKLLNRWCEGARCEGDRIIYIL